MDWEPRKPLDRTRHKRHPESQELSRGIEPGDYVYVVDTLRCVHVAPDGPHHHPLVLGGGKAACYAGTLRIGEAGAVEELTNLSGAFRFDRQELLRAVAELIENAGVPVASDALIWWAPDGEWPPRRIGR